MGLSRSDRAARVKYREAYRRIYERIVRGEYLPGQRVTIEALVRELGMSHTPIREALRQLEAQGVVTYRAHVGARVAEVDLRAYGETLSALAVLEGWATALAAPRISFRVLERLRALNRHMRRAAEAGDYRTFDRLNRRFHLSLCAASGQRYLMELLDTTWNRLDAVRRSVFPFIPHRALRSVQEHDRILDLIQRKSSPGRLEAFARQHKLRTLRTYVRWGAQRADRPSATVASAGGERGA